MNMAELNIYSKMPELEPINLVPEDRENTDTVTTIGGIPINKKQSSSDGQNDKYNNRMSENKDGYSLRGQGRSLLVSGQDGAPGAESGDIGDDISCRGSSLEDGSTLQTDKNASKCQSIWQTDESKNTKPGEEAKRTGFHRQDDGSLARRLAAQSLEADMSEWLVFDTNWEHPSTLKAEADEFLAKNVPSVVKLSDGIGWISVTAPHKSDDRHVETDVDGLLDVWDDLQDSAEPVTFQKIQQLAVAHGTLCGKWMIFKKRGVHADLTWERVFRATIDGRLGISAKVSTVTNQMDNKHVICVYNRDFTSVSDVRELESRLRGIGVKCSLTYKPDVFTYLGVYRGNEWGLKPTIYASDFDLRKNSSTIVSLYGE